MNQNRPAMYDDVEKCVDDVIAKVGKKIVMGIPLALGKPVQFTNALYQRAKADPSLDLTILTALSLETPTGNSELESRLLGPMVDRVWKDVPLVDYVADLRSSNLPENIKIIEFFMRPGGWLASAYAQQNYLCTNYTHACRDAVNYGLNVGASLCVRGEIGGKTVFSPSCNADTPMEVSRLLREEEAKGRKVAIIGQVTDKLPFMYGDAVATPDEFDMIIDAEHYNQPLFGIPKEPVTSPDHMLGLFASSLVKDAGTLQIGIGSLGDALVYGLQLRHENNDIYKSVLNDAGIDNWAGLVDDTGGMSPFTEGLAGSTEMFVDGFLELFKSGILKRKLYPYPQIQQLADTGKLDGKPTADTLAMLMDKGAISGRLTVKDVSMLTECGIIDEAIQHDGAMLHFNDAMLDPDMEIAGAREALMEKAAGPGLKNGVVLYGSFFVGPQDFYDALFALSDAERQLFNMSGVEYVNQLYGEQDLKIAQRRHGRFINAGLMCTLNGAVVSDGLSDARVISGPGGQYNFVSMAHALPDARSILMIRTTRGIGDTATSNMVWEYPHCTIPRHLRDIVVTEYGIADIRGRTDREVIEALIQISDSRFQPKLVQQAIKANKIPSDYRVPEVHAHNYHEKILARLDKYRPDGHFEVFPFGTQFTNEEIILGRSLRGFKAHAEAHKFDVMKKLAGEMRSAAPEAAMPYLDRMNLASPGGFKEKLLQKIVVTALKLEKQI